MKMITVIRLGVSLPCDYKWHFLELNKNGDFNLKANLKDMPPTVSKNIKFIDNSIALMWASFC